MLLDGGFIKYLRETKGLSQADLAKAAGLSRSFMSQIESGKRSASPHSAHEIARVLEVGTGSLMANSPTPCPQCGRRVSYMDQELR